MTTILEGVLGSLALIATMLATMWLCQDVLLPVIKFLLGA